MGVGDGIVQALQNQMGGGAVGGDDGVDGDGGGGGGGDIGVEATAVVVITLLAVLGNAMVVATLVRRSLLHHPSNRLVLSLTSSNLILTVVVLPGMVTSLLMSPASPNLIPRHKFNNSGMESTGNAVESTHLSSLISKRTNDSVASALRFNGSSTVFDSPVKSSGSERRGTLDVSSISPEDYNYDNALTFSLPLEGSPEATSPFPEYLTTEVPLILEVSHDILNPPVSLYSHRDVSLLSQELEDSKQTWHHGTVGSSNFHHDLSQQISVGIDELNLSSPKDEFLENDGNQHISIQVTKRRDLSETKDVLGDVTDDDRDEGKKLNGKETKSILAADHRMKSLHGTESNGHLERETSRSERKAIQAHTSHQHSKNKSKHSERSKIAHQGLHQEIEGGIPDAERNPEDIFQESSSSSSLNLSSSRLIDHPDERVRHTSNKRKKQGMRRYQHRKQRLRRNREESDDSGDNHSSILGKQDSGSQGEKKVDKLDSGNQGEKRVDKQDSGNQGEKKVDNVDDRDFIKPSTISKTSSSDVDNVREEEIHRAEQLMLKDHINHGHISSKVQVHIRQEQGGAQHVILVRGVQQIEEQQEKQMVVVVVDQHELERQNSEQKQKLHVKVEQQVRNAPPSVWEPQSFVKDDHSEDHQQLPDHEDLGDTRVLMEYDDNDDNNDKLKQGQTLPLKRGENSSQRHRKDQPPVAYAQRLHTTDQESGLEGDQIQKMEVGDGHQMNGTELESHRWGRILCQGAAFFTNLVTASSALTVAVIAIDRYLAIVRPLVYGVMVTRGRCLLMLSWCWGQALLTALPPLLGWARYDRRGPHDRCGVVWSDSPSYTAVWTISVFLIPFGVMTVCYYQILQVARNKCRRIRVGKVSETSPPNTPDPTMSCLDGFPFPLSVATLTSPPIGSKPVSPRPHSPLQRKLSSFGNLSNSALANHVSHPPGITASQQWNGSGPHLVRNTANGVLDSRLDRGVPCRSYSVSGMLRAVDSTTNTNDPTNKPKRKLGDFGRSRSLCQVPQQPPRPCLRRVQSTFSVRHTLKKLSLGTRRPSWNWDGSPSKGFWTVFVVMGAHLLTWGPYTCMAVAEAVLGHEHQLIPYWVTVTCTLLLFTASVFYPIVYGLYNRNIRKELLTCLCPTWTRRRGSQARRPSTLPSYSGSVLDFTSLRQRGVLEKPELCYNQRNGVAGTIATISSTVGSLACPTPLMIMAEDDSGIPARGYNLRKPSQDSGTVMIGGEDQDSDVDTPTPVPHQHTTRRVSAPSVLSTVREDPHTTTVCIEDTPHVSRHLSLNCRNAPTSQRKMAIIPLSTHISSAGPVVRSLLRRSRSLDKLSVGDKEITLDSSISYRSLRKKRVSPAVRETQFSAPPISDRVQRRRGSIALMKVAAIPEDCGLTEYPEMTDSGRGSVDSGSLSRMRSVNGHGSVDSSDLTKSFLLRCRGSGDGPELTKAHLLNRRGSIDSTELAIARTRRQSVRDSEDLNKNTATRQISIDEGIGGDCLPEESSWE